MIEAFFGNVIQMLSFPFMVRAFIVGILVALCAALLGVSLVLKRYAMIGDGLSHVGFAALALATALDLDPPLIHRPQVPVAGARPVEYGSKLLGRRAGPGIGAGVHHGELPADVQKLHLCELALNAEQEPRGLSAGPQRDRETLEGAA